MNIHKLLAAFVALLCCVGMTAQDKVTYPDISYAGTPRTLTLAGLNVSGAEGYEDYMLTGISGLTIGQTITLPGNEITEASPSPPTAPPMASCWASWPPVTTASTTPRMTLLLPPS